MSLRETILAAVRKLRRWLTRRQTKKQRLNASVSPSPPGPAAGVGVCLSGGGSRAMTAGLGQLRALAALTTDTGPVLSQITALSTVSGGSWLGVPWVYLQGETTDEDYLNGFVADPGRLVLTETAGHNAAETLDVLPPGNPGRNIAAGFSIEDLLAEMVLVRLWHRTPWHMMWQTLIARHLLQPYGLYTPGHEAAPTSLFTLDNATLAAEVVGPNPSLRATTAHLVASGPTRLERPFLICNTAMFVKTDESSFEFLVPVQATPLMTGILGTAGGVDANGRAPGGGGVTSFAFGSDLVAVDGDRVEVAQRRQWALTDIVGASSAAFAEALQNLAEKPSTTAARLRAAIQQRYDDLGEQMKLDLAPSDHGGFDAMVAELTDEVIHDVLRALDPRALIPRYRYWPVRDIAANSSVEPTRFADGGSLENTGVAGMLAHPQIHTLFVFVNSQNRLEVDGGQLVVSSQIPPLFGLRPHEPGKGYVPYDAADDDADKGLFNGSAEFRHNKVFPTHHFEILLERLQEAAGTNVSSRPAIVKQRLPVLDNEWFGITGNREVDVVWSYLNPSTEWMTLLGEDVRAKVASISNFPNYATFDTELDATRVNLLSNYTAWTMTNDDTIRSYFTEPFRPTQ